MDKQVIRRSSARLKRGFKRASHLSRMPTTLHVKKPVGNYAFAKANSYKIIAAISSFIYNHKELGYQLR